MNPGGPSRMAESEIWHSRRFSGPKHHCCLAIIQISPTQLAFLTFSVWLVCIFIGILINAHKKGLDRVTLSALFNISSTEESVEDEAWTARRVKLR